MTRKAIFWGLAFLCFESVSAQSNLTLRDATLGQGDVYRTDRMYGGTWRSPQQFTVMHRDTLWAIQNNGQKTMLSTLDMFKKATGLAVPRIPILQWLTPELVSFRVKGERWVVSLKEKWNLPCPGCLPQASNIPAGIIQIPEGGNDEQFHEVSGFTVYTRGANIFLIKPGIPEPQPVTFEQNPGVVSGSGYVHRQEFGIQTGMFFSPAGKKLAFYRKDESMVAEYPLVVTDTRIAQQAPIRYPMAGETSEQVKIGIFDAQTQETIYLHVKGPVDQYLTSVTWNATGDEIYVGVLNRGQDTLELRAFDPKTGLAKRTLFTETAKAWVEPEHPISFLPGQPDVMVWHSERSGFNHLYLYHKDGKLIKTLTQGDFEVVDILGIHPEGTHLLLQTTRSSPLDRNIEWLEVKSGKWTRLDPGPGMWSAQLSPDGKQVWIEGNHPGSPYEAYMVSIGKKPIQVYTAPSPFVKAGLVLPKAKVVTVMAADGKTPLYGRLIIDERVKPGKKKPVLIYVYGGPHAQMITNGWLQGARLWDYYMAMQGYVVFTLDNRGSAHRGYDFESVIHRNLGVAEVADQMEGVKYLKTLPETDSTRIGVHGWSYGGFMTLSMLTKYPKTFACGVAGGPVVDWKWYEVMYGERYMDTPQENPEGYAHTALTGKAAQVNMPILVIHGAQDDVVVPQHAMEFVQACIAKNKPVDLFLYPTHKHNVVGPDRLHLMEKITMHLNRHLKFGN
jgi:dipeptidyl-peptidase-4